MELKADANPFVPQGFSSSGMKASASIFIPSAREASARSPAKDSVNKKSKGGFSKHSKQDQARKGSNGRGDGRRREKNARDDEVRALSAQLREKEELIEEMKARQSEQNIAMAKEVEEKVSQKLFNVSKMSEMYQDSLKQSMNKTKKMEQKKSSSFPREGMGSSGSKFGQKKISSFQSEGTVPSGAKLKIAPGLTNFKTPNVIVKENIDGSDALDTPELQATELMIEERRISAAKESVYQTLEKIRKTKSLLQDFCFKGISEGAPADFVKNCEEIENFYADKLLSYAVQDFSGTVEVNPLQYARRMCEVPLKQFNLVRQVIDKTKKKSEADESSTEQIQRIFLTEVEKFSNRLMLIFDEVQKALMDKCILSSIEKGDDFTTSKEKQLREILQFLSLTIAELMRLPLYYGVNDDIDANFHSRLIFEIEKYQQLAVVVAPREGIAFESLSKHMFTISTDSEGKSFGRRKKDVFLSAYYLARGMSAEHPYLAAREELLGIFEEQKSASDRLENVSALSRLTPQEHIKRFKVHFLAAAGVAYSRTGADKLSVHLTKAKRHVGTMLQCLTSMKSGEQGRGSKGSFAAFDQPSYKKTSPDGGDKPLDSSTLGLCRQVDRTLCQALVIALTLVDAVGRMGDLAKVVEETKWKNAYPSFSDDEWTVEDHMERMDAQDKENIESRFVQQRLHKLQCMPGLLDLLKLIVELLSSILRADKLSIGCSESGMSPRTLATTRVFCYFFEWLESASEYHTALTVLNSTAWENVQSELPTLVPTLDRLSQKYQIEVGVLRDDADLIGFQPLQKTIHKHTSGIAGLIDQANDKEVESYTALQGFLWENMVSFDHDADKWLSLYAIRCHQSIKCLQSQNVQLGEITFCAKDNERHAILSCSSGSQEVLTVIVEDKSKKSHSLPVHGLDSPPTSAIISRDQFMGEGTESKMISAVSRDSTFFAQHDEYTEQTLPPSLTAPQGEKVDRFSEDDDLDLNNLILENIDGDVPPGFSPKIGPKERNNSIDTASEGTGEDFAAMCAALLTVPLSGYSEDANHVSSMDFEATQQSDTVPEKRGLLKVKIPSEAKRSEGSGGTSNVGQDYGEISLSRSIAMGSPPRSSYSKHSSITSYDRRGVEAPLIVVDAPNVAMRHGLNEKFSCKGIQLALNYFHGAGHDVIAFLPDYYLNFERVGELRRQARLKIGNVRPSQIPDDVQILQDLVNRGFIVGTPSQDYDDSYCINYAKRRGGYVVSNDMYRDHVKRFETRALREEAFNWIKSHVVSFTFVGDEFLPNPDAPIFKR